jgi:hypothetical protein
MPTTTHVTPFAAAPRELRLQVPVTEQERTLIRALTKREDLTMAQFMRRLVAEHAGRQSEHQAAA